MKPVEQSAIMRLPSSRYGEANDRERHLDGGDEGIHFLLLMRR